MKKGTMKKLFSVCIGVSMLVSAVPSALAEDGAENQKMEFIEDFQSYEVSEKPSYVVTDSGMSNSCVVTDGDNKVFAVKYNGTNSQGLGMNLGKTFSSGAYNYSFKVKIVNAKAQDWFSPMMGLKNANGNDVITSKIYSSWQLKNTAVTSFADMEGLKTSDGYYNVSRIVDLDKGKDYIQTDLNGSYTEQSLLNKTSFTKIFITGMHSGDGFTSGQTVTGDTALSDYSVLYIDDIKITPVDATAITSKNAPVGGKVSAANKVFKATFNNPLGTVSADNVTVTKDGSDVSVGYTVSKSGKTLTVNFSDNLTAGSGYKITAKGVSILSAEADTEYTIAEFTAVDPADGFVENFEGYSVGDVPYFVSADAAFADSCVIKDGENKVLAVRYDRSENYKNLNISLGTTFSEGAYDYSYKAKIVNANEGDWYFPFMTLQNSGVDNFLGKIGGYGWQLLNGAWTSFDNMATFKGTDGYYSINRRIDLDNAKHYVQQGGGTWTEESLTTGAPKKISAINIRGIKNTTDGGFTAAQVMTGESDRANYGVIYIDDISLTASRELSSGGAKITDLAQAAGKTVTARVNTSYVAKNDYLVIFALYNGSTLEAVKTVKSSDIVNNWAEADIEIGTDTAGLKLSYMVFDSLGGLVPIGTKTDF